VPFLGRDCLALTTTLKEDGFFLSLSGERFSSGRQPKTPSSVFSEGKKEKKNQDFVNSERGKKLTGGGGFQ